MSFEIYKTVEKVSEVDLQNKINNSINAQSNFLAFYTDSILCAEYKNLENANKLLEIRVFNEKEEIKATRTSLNDDFIFRIIDDDYLQSIDSKNENYFVYSEKQYLDIDSQKSEKTSYTTIGGGKYTLPIENAEKILINNYAVFNEIGEGQIKDFRIVKLLKKGEK